MDTNEMRLHPHSGIPSVGRSENLSATRASASETLFLACAFLGAVIGSIVGAILSDQSQGSLDPEACGSLGCIVGCLVMSVVASIGMFFAHRGGSVASGAGNVESPLHG